MDTTISGSIIKRRASSQTFFMCLNFTKILTIELNIAEKRFLELTKTGSQYKCRIMDKDNGRGHRIAYDKATQSASVFLDQKIFQLTETDKRKAKIIPVQVSESMFTFDFDKEQYLKDDPLQQFELFAKEIIVDETSKVEAGFVTDSSWGVGIKERANDAIRKHAIESLQAKIQGFYNAKS